MQRLPALGGCLETIAGRFEREGALGIALVDASRFSGIERVFGLDAERHALGRLAELIQDAVQGLLAADDVVCRGEMGRSELLVLLLRGHDDPALEEEDLPAVRSAIEEAIARHGSRVAYPYVKEAPPVYTGLWVALRNPTLGVESELHRAVQEARRDANLRRRLVRSAERSSFLRMVMRGDVYCVYEPIVEVASKTVHAYEALSRGPEGSDLHGAQTMFRTAERQDLLFQLDCLCRRKALEGAQGLPQGTKLFLNIRPTAIHDPSFKTEALCRTLEQSELRPSDLVFEISEQESIQNFEIFREVRDEYGKVGFQIALDDVGAGHASLQSVMELSPEYLKVDRAFVSRVDEDPARQQLLRALHTVAQKIGARIIAEGLDTLEELSTLGDLEIPFGQGWLFGKPTPFRARG